MPIDGSPEPPPDLVHDARPPWRIVIRLAWPVLVQQFLILSVGLYDQYLAGNNPPPGENQLVDYQAAQANANYIAWFLSSSTTLVSVGGTALVARLVGAGDRAGAIRATNQSVLLAVLFGLAGTPVVLAVLPAGVHALGLADETALVAVHFLRPILALITCQLVAQAGIACLVGAGDTRTGPVVLSGVAMINIPLSWVCFHGLGPIPGLGFFGIGIGTATSHTIGCLAVLAVLAHGRYGLRLRPGLMVPDFSLIYRLLRVSVPASIDSLSIGLCQLWFLSLVNALGVVAAAAHGIVIRCEGLG
jgi:Na+-driven multidrug efflux pump